MAAVLEDEVRKNSTKETLCMIKCKKIELVVT
jgi:hypothetical protein